MDTEKPGIATSIPKENKRNGWEKSRPFSLRTQSVLGAGLIPGFAARNFRRKNIKSLDITTIYDKIKLSKGGIEYDKRTNSNHYEVKGYDFY